ncbi:MAG TPA: efflux RND transporter periplasmic adaptor subunit, partial [Acidiferrobacteraceae bacterium]|nr:efflux RND transporter periplasmic adaptor subunit [Acidiferrobacteraceae bacterium]
VTPRSLVNVMPRVSGLLQSVHYRQGQKVTAGELLAQIDPRPFEITVAQDRAQLAQTRAQLAGARRDLARYEILLKQDSIAAQQVADERATVDGLEAAEQMNAAVLANARLQLQWTRITAPVSGVVGLRLVDAGNMVTTAGAVGSAAGSGGATPIATIAQIQPVDVTFALPQQDIGSVVEQLGRGRQLPAQAYNARNTRLLAAGVLIAADNQINASTGTLLLRARFRNTQFALFPNQFVNVRLLVRTIPNAVVVPTTAVGVGALGSYVYVIQHDHKARLQSVQTGVSAGPLTQIISGLVPGDTVATDGLDRLRNGAQVRLVQAAPNATQRARSTRAAQPR